MRLNVNSASPLWRLFGQARNQSGGWISYYTQRDTGTVVTKAYIEIQYCLVCKIRCQSMYNGRAGQSLKGIHLQR